ncbi:MAG: M20 family metallopeptidase [Anaerolineaceae bacterium]
MKQSIASQAQELFPYTQSMRRDFHRHPELGFHEVRSAGIVANELGKLGLEVHAGIAETGVVGLLENAAPGPTILLRFDMDALPITEATGAEYASTVPGVMHACGHDSHMAIGLTVARMLKELSPELCGQIKFVFQPAEEVLGGAERMVKEGVLKDPKPDVALAMHVWNERPLGWVGLASGPVMAGADFFDIQITGKGGHGAMPQTAHDPIMAAAAVILALQSIVSRNVSPFESAVVSVTQIVSGETYNVIPEKALLKGTIRAFERSVREQVVARLEEVVIGTCRALGCEATINYLPYTPAVINDKGVTAIVVDVARKLFSPEEVDTTYQSMGSEDMAFILNEIPGCFMLIGSANNEKGLNAGHHHPKFDFDEAVLPRAVTLMVSTVAELLKKTP